PFIPEEDAQGQILLLFRYLNEKLNASPQGFWLPERVWNTNLPKLLAPTGLRYTIVDDSLFRYAGFGEDELFGYYVTEHNGFPLVLFPINKKLRYAIPFKPPQETLEALRFWATDTGDAAVAYADDGEKFGLWPGTYRSVIQEGWLENFVTLLEKNQDWVQMHTFREYLEKYPPLGRAYLPPASYEEMMTWSLPALPAIAYEEILQELKQEGRYEKYRPYLRGGFWENFFIKYTESNHLHKKMLYVSAKVHQALPESAHREEREALPPSLRALWKGQVICPYWHGLFGGIYHSHLRHSVYQNLITAERLAEVAQWGNEKYLKYEIIDLDKDLHPEILVTSPELGVTLKPDYGGALVEFDYRPKKFNITNVLTRRPEAYHRRIKKTGVAPASPALANSAGWEEALVYDWYTRYSFLDHFLGEETTFDQYRRCQYPELGDFVNQPYELVDVMEEEGARRMGVLLHRSGGLWMREGKVPIEIHKLFLFQTEGAQLQVEYEVVNQSPQEVNLWFGVEINLNLLAGDDPRRYFLFPGVKIDDPRLNSSGMLIGVDHMCLRDEFEGFEVDITTPPGDLWRFPLETISQSEKGLEKTFQGSALLFHWRFTLKPQERKDLPITLSCMPV
ncbi:MAG: DUF1926 domain-containing protein, partial [Deltaproteobacteria bacterium]|nr:DUF1926 domain-containing protein [Deltaproteobacteria bacterium]